MTLPAKSNVLGIPVSSRNLDIATDLDAAYQHACTSLITFVNPHACWMADKHSDYVEMLRTFDWVLCDGIGMAVAARRLNGLSVQRAAFDFSSIADSVFQWLEKACMPVVLVGGGPQVADSAAQKLVSLYPALRIAGCFSGFATGPEDAHSRLLGIPGSAVVCGMGAPLQERFLLELKNQGWQGIGFTCGGFFDQLNSKRSYYPRWIDVLNLRFLYRLYREPRRLARRYLVEYQAFMKRFVTAWFRGDQHP